MQSDSESTEEFSIDRIRALCRKGFETCTPHIVDIGNGLVADTPPAIRVRAHDNLGKHGMGSRPTTAWFHAILNLTRPYLEEEQFRKWSDELRAKFESVP